MGQSARQRKQPPSAAGDRAILAVFPTNLGWFGLLGRGGQLWAVIAGHSTAQTVRESAARSLSNIVPTADLRTVDLQMEHWNPELRHRLEQFALGAAVDFRDVPLALRDLTEFQRRVIQATRRIRYGCTASYGEIAVAAGAPRAARAVGTVMAANRYPIIVPCHRVIASGGRIGGYSGPRGIDFKQQLLRLEADE